MPQLTGWTGWPPVCVCGGGGAEGSARVQGRQAVSRVWTGIAFCVFCVFCVCVSPVCACLCGLVNTPSQPLQVSITLCTNHPGSKLAQPLTHVDMSEAGCSTCLQGHWQLLQSAMQLLTTCEGCC
jgi:hypothetical protein